MFAQSDAAEGTWYGALLGNKDQMSICTLILDYEAARRTLSWRCGALPDCAEVLGPVLSWITCPVIGSLFGRNVHISPRDGQGGEDGATHAGVA